MILKNKDEQDFWKQLVTTLLTMPKNQIPEEPLEHIDEMILEYRKRVQRKES